MSAKGAKHPVTRAAVEAYSYDRFSLDLSDALPVGVQNAKYKVSEGGHQ